MKKYSFLLISIFCFTISFAQKPLQISAEGKKYTIPCFKEDSILTLEKWYTDQNIIEPIKQSKGDWEIRLFGIRSDKWTGEIYTIGSLNDSIYMSQIWYEGGDPHDSVFRREKLVYGADGYPVFRRMVHLKLIEPIDSFLLNMIKNQLGCLEDTKCIVDSLKLTAFFHSHAHPPSICFFEFKVNELCRDFRYESKYLEGNESIQYFKWANNLSTAMYKLFSKQAKYNK